MTLTRSPCDLDTMSLFQEMKLKRRKVDSRCSSDGESVADTSTSSPDLASPVSPCPKTVLSTPSPANRDRTSPDSGLPEPSRRDPPHHLLPVKKEVDEGDQVRSAEPQAKEGGDDNSVFDGGGPSDDHQCRVIQPPCPSPQREVIQSPTGQRPTEVAVQVKREVIQSPQGQQQQQQQHHREVIQSPQGQQQQQHRDVIQGPMGHKTIIGQCPSPGQQQQQQLQRVGGVQFATPAQRESLHSPGGGGGQREMMLAQRSLGPCPSPSLRPGNCQQQQQQQQQQRHPQGATVPPPNFWLTTSSSQQNNNNNNNSASGCRINGVRPELIGGNLNYSSPSTPDMKSPLAPAPRSPVNQGLRPTPTVIMGEAGGVRTMIWSQPQQPQQPTGVEAQQMLSASTSASCWSTSSSSSGNGGVSNEETAAQLLLTLGQDLHPHTNNAVTSQPRPLQPPLNMERLWAGDLTQLPASQQMTALNLTASAQQPQLNLAWAQQQQLQLQQRGLGEKPLPPVMTITGDHHHHGEADPEEDEQPMICMICEDKATGLHYGIITCEGCKGFFKRTVQNRRVYTCVADGNCEITKAQRNRCQYCRFKKCIEQGMVLQAVREDRMPGGRNSGAVYNLYKVKYKKHKKAAKNGQLKANPVDKQKTVITEHGLPPHLINGTILKTALTNPSEVVHLRQRLDNAVSSSRDRTFTIEVTLNMIQTLIDCDEFQDIATLRNLDELLDHKSDLSEKLCQIGDSIVYKLVQWTKRLPFYLELPVEVHTRLLTHKWHELLVLTTSAYQAIHGAHKLTSTGSDGTEADFTQEVSNNLCTLQTCLTSMMGRPITMDQLRQDVGLMVEKITHVTLMFRRVKLRMEEYVCLKVITMLNQGRGGSNELEAIQDRYMTCLRSFVEHHFPQQPTRFHELLVRLPEVQSAAALLLESKMFYVPFLLNSAIQR